MYALYFVSQHRLPSVFLVVTRFHLVSLCMVRAVFRLGGIIAVEASSVHRLKVTPAAHAFEMALHRACAVENPTHSFLSGVGWYSRCNSTSSRPSCKYTLDPQWLVRYSAADCR